MSQDTKENEEIKKEPVSEEAKEDTDCAAEGKAAEQKTDKGRVSETESNEGEPDGAGDNEAGDIKEEGEDAAEETAGEEKETVKPDKKDQKIAELNDRYVRLFAEFDNYRKRTESEKTAMFAEGERTVLLKILPLVDNFERALGSVPEEQKDSALADGIQKVYKAFTDQLKELGVTPIETVGHEFDANLHNAVMHVEDDSAGENIIVEEFQKGYMFKDKVLRYSMVKVAN